MYLRLGAIFGLVSLAAFGPGRWGIIGKGLVLTVPGQREVQELEVFNSSLHQSFRCKKNNIKICTRSVLQQKPFKNLNLFEANSTIKTYLFLKQQNLTPIGTSTFDLSSTSTEVLLRRWLRCVFRWPSRNLLFGNRALQPTVEGLHQRFVETWRSKQFCFGFWRLGNGVIFKKKPFRYGLWV